jgi:hypothetical protein
VRVDETSRLLDQYTALLGQAEHTKQLMMNPLWAGAQDVCFYVSSSMKDELMSTGCESAGSGGRSEVYC